MLAASACFHMLPVLTSGFPQITELAGYTSRVWNMFDVFDQVSRGEYQRVIETTNADGKSTRSAQALQIKGERPPSLLSCTYC